MKHLFEDKNKVIHECRGDRAIDIFPDTYLVWTLCEKDVPANLSFKSDEIVSCKECEARGRK